MKKLTTFGAALGLLGLGVSAFAQFTPGNLVVSVVKSATPGVTSISGANRHALREYTVLGIPTPTPDVNIYGLASEATGGNRRATIGGTATSEGFINLSTDGRYIIFVGYDAEIGTQPTNTQGAPAQLGTTASEDVNRVVGRYEWALAPNATTLDTRTFLTESHSTGSIRSAASTDGISLWTAGAGSPATSAGVRYVAYSATPAGTALQLAASPANPTNTRVVKIYNGQLYVSTASGNFVGVNSVGTGTPSTDSQTVTRLFDATIGASKASSAYDFIFDGSDVVYVADDTSGTAATANGGLQKWVRGDGGWTNTLTVVIPGASTARVGLRGIAKASATLFYGTTTDKRLVSIDITAPALPVVTVLATAPVDEEFRDVELLPILNNSASGTITFQAGMSNVPRNQPLSIILTPTVGSPIIQTVTPDANGNFTTQPVPPATYRLRVKTATTLSEATNVNLLTGNATGLTFTLRGGDITNDNAADIADLLVLINSYNQVSPSAGYSAAADINADGADDIADLLILIGNYNQIGNN